MRIFDEAGVLKMGKQKLVFYFDRRAENHVQSATAGELYDRQLHPLILIAYACAIVGLTLSLFLACRYAAVDDSFDKEKSLEKYKNRVALSHQQDDDSRVEGGAASSGNMDLMLDWLDRLVLAQAQSGVAVARQQNLASTAGSESPSGGRGGASPEMQDLYSFCCLVVDMPMFPHPVLHEEKHYPSVTPHMPDVAFQMLSVSDGVGPRSIFTTDRGDSAYEFNLIGKPFSGEALRHIVDWEMETDNPCEAMYRRLAHDTIRGRGGAGDASVKPNLEEKERLDRILRTPGDHMRSEDKDLMYRFR